MKSVPKSDGQRLLPRGCFVIASILSIFVGLSLFFGLFFVIRKDYGYSMSDAFTLASYIVAVGALICSFLLACHFPHCQCWRKSEAQWEELYELRETTARLQNAGMQLGVINQHGV
jgi:hypothetical protein